MIGCVGGWVFECVWVCVETYSLHREHTHARSREREPESSTVSRCLTHDLKKAPASYR